MTPARILPALGTTVLALFAAGCQINADETPQMPPAPQVSVADVLVQELNTWDEFSGRIAAVESVQIRPRVAGVIDSVQFTEGHEVNPDDVLFVIDQRPYRAELSRAEAELEAARAQVAPARSEAARARTLFEKRNISQEVLDQRIAAEAQIAAQVRAAQAAVDIARLNLEFTEVRSPIAGRTSRALVTKGNLVDAGNTLLTTVVSLDPVYVYFETDEQVFLRSTDIQRRGTRHPVRVALSNEEEFPHRGVMDFVDNQLNPDTGTITSRAVLDNRDRKFTPGLFARVRVQGGEKQRTLLIDDKSILTDQDRKFVYVLGRDNTAQRRDVKPGRVVDGLRIINEGLTASDRIIVHGVQKVFFPGMPVDPQLIEMGQPPQPVGVAQPTAEEAVPGQNDQAEAPST